MIVALDQNPTIIGALLAASGGGGSFVINTFSFNDTNDVLTLDTSQGVIDVSLADLEESNEHFEITSTSFDGATLTIATSAGNLTVDLSGLEDVTDLGLTRTASSVTVTSSTGQNVVVPGASVTEAGVMVAGDKIKINRYPNLADPAGGGIDDTKYELRVIAGAYVFYPIYEVTTQIEVAELTQQTGFQVFDTLNIEAPIDDAYVFDWYFRFSYNNGSTNIEIQLVLDPGTANEKVFGGIDIEPKDVAGGQGEPVNNEAGGTTNTGTDYRDTRGGTLDLSLLAGTHTIELQYRNEQANSEATIYEERMNLRTK